MGSNTSASDASAYCRVCEKQMPIHEAQPRHALHFMLSMVSLGLWLPVWGLSTSGKLVSPRCSNCGSKVQRNMPPGDHPAAHRGGAACDPIRPSRPGSEL